MPKLDAELKVLDGVIKYPDLPSSINDLSVDATLTNSLLDIKTLTANADGAELRGKVKITDFTSPFLDSEINLNVDLSKIQNYYPLDDSTKIDGALTVRSKVSGLLDNVDELGVVGTVELASISYQSSYTEQPIEDLNGKIILSNEAIRFEEVSLISGQSDMQMQGVLTGYGAFMADSIIPLPDPVFEGEVTSTYLNLTEQISEDTTSTFVGPLELPAIQLDIRFEADAFEFNGISMSDASGDFTLTNGIMGVENIKARFFDGALNASGSFDFSNPYKPAFRGGVELNEIPVVEFFQAFSGLNSLVHLGDYLQGLFSSEASFGVQLDKDLNPQYESIIAQGSFGTRESSFGTMPLQTVVASYTGVQELRSLNIDDWSHSFSVSGKRLHVQDFRFSAGEYEVNVSGSQGFDGSLEYRLSLELPQSVSDALDNAPINNALGAISTVANKTLKSPENGKVIIDLIASGTFMDPVIKLDADNMKARFASSLAEGVKTEVGSQLDSLEQSTKDRVEAALEEQKQRLEDRAEEEIQELVGELSGDSLAIPTTVDSLKEKGEDILKDRLKGLLNRRKRNN